MNIELQNVSLSYDGNEPLFRNVSLVVRAGQFVIIEGPSGSGKSSLLRLLNRLREPSSGRILADGIDITTVQPPRFRRQVAYLQQSPVMLTGSVADNLMFPFRLASARNGTPPPTTADLDKQLQHFQVDAALGDDAATLSQGQRQRVALIRALLLRPQVLLCDEPTSSLDPESRQIVQRELEVQSAENQRTVIVVTHIDFQPRCPVRRFRLSRRDGLQEVTS